VECEIVEKGTECKWVKFDVPPRSTVNPTAGVEMTGGGQEEEEGDAEMNEGKEPEEEHKDDGNYEAEPLPARRGSRGRGRVRAKESHRSRDQRKSRSHLHLLPLSYRRPRRSPPVNAVLGEEDVTVEISNTVVPLCSISASTEAEKEGDGDGESLASGKENGKKRWEWAAGIERFGDQ